MIVIKTKNINSTKAVAKNTTATKHGQVLIGAGSSK